MKIIFRVTFDAMADVKARAAYAFIRIMKTA
jgi:hypothetical protein